LTNIEALLALQEHDRRISEIEQQLRDIPARKELELKRLDEHKQALESVREKLKAKLSEIKQIELDVENQRERISKFRQQQLEIKTNKEFRAVESEIKTAEDQIRGFEDGELVVMEELEALREDSKVREADLAAEEKAVQADVAAFDERAVALEEDLAAEREARERAVAPVDREWLERYDIIRRRRPDAVVRLENGVCGGCHMRLPPAALHDTRRQDTMTVCDFCGRLLH
jgi:predicted  nucleic acid-binding Zn-ribbon protein